MFKKIVVVLFLSLFTVTQAWANEPAWQTIDPSKSSLQATFTQFSIPVSGDFKQFEGRVFYDSAQLETTRAQLSVNTASYDLGDPLYNEEVAGEDWFFSTRYPQALFELTGVSRKEATLFANGRFTLRGVTKDIRFPVKVNTANGLHHFSGKFSIKRLDYGVGQGDWADEALVNDEVVIDFKMVVPSK